jgi:hypothetical protein
LPIYNKKAVKVQDPPEGCPPFTSLKRALIYVKSERAEWIVPRRKIRFFPVTHQELTVRAHAGVRLAQLLKRMRQDQGYDSVERSLTREEAKALPMTNLRRFYGG